MPLRSAAIPSLPYQGSVESLKGKGDGTLASEKQRLTKVTREFESFFFYQMLKAMRKSNSMLETKKDGFMSGDMGKDEFMQMFDMELSRRMVTGRDNSLASKLYYSMVRLVEAKFRDPNDEIEIKPLSPDANTPVKLKKMEESIQVSPKIDSKPIEKTESYLPIAGFRPKVTTDPIYERYGQFIDSAARETNLDSTLIASVISAESSGNPDAISTKGAKGLMQLIDSTAHELGVKNPFDPADNIRGGSRYLRKLLDRFGDLPKALAAYNAGPSNVKRYGGVPPFPETQRYVAKIISQYEQKSTSVALKSSKVSTK